MLLMYTHALMDVFSCVVCVILEFAWKSLNYTSFRTIVTWVKFTQLQLELSRLLYVLHVWQLNYFETSLSFQKVIQLIEPVKLNNSLKIYRSSLIIAYLEIIQIWCLFIKVQLRESKRSDPPRVALGLKDLDLLKLCTLKYIVNNNSLLKFERKTSIY